VHLLWKTFRNIRIQNLPEGAMTKEISGLKREIKRAKLFETQRLVRRLRQLANKKRTETQIKKNQRKIERLEKELDFLKDAQVDEVAGRIASKEDEDEQENMADDGHGEDMDLQKRALDRIINSAKPQKFLKRTDASAKVYVAAGTGSNDAEIPGLKQQQRVVKQKSDTQTTGHCVSGKLKINKEAEDDERNDDHAEVLRQKAQQKPAKLELRAPMTMTGESELSMGDEHGRSSDEEGHVPESREGKTILSCSLGSELLVEENDGVDGFLPSSDLSESDFDDDVDGRSSPELKPRGLESCFVQSMSGLKGERGTKARNKQGEEKGKPGDKKGKRNRKGPRARQEMWEKMHGKNAKHLWKNETGMRSKESKEPKKQTSMANMKSSLKHKSNNETLHPSWEAMKKKRLQETLKVEFKGQKIKFDDSE